MEQREESGAPPADILVTGHFRERHGYAIYRAHGSGNWLITYTLNGQGFYRQPGISLLAEPGDIVVLRPGALHDYSVPVEKQWEFLWAHFQPRMAWFVWWYLPEVGRGLYKTHIQSEQMQERLKRAFLSLHTDSQLPLALRTQESGEDEPLDRLQRELALNRLEEVLLLAVRESERGRRRPFDQRVQTILGIFSSDLKQQHSLESLAERVALSPSRLAHLFKQEVGDSVNNLLLSMRLEKAARLLEFSTYSISMIAEEVGFSSGYYFSRQFHRRFGVSPREYRERLVRGVPKANLPSERSMEL